MIGKAEWFQRRKYSGWGITPKTWQGWVYLILLFIPFIAFQILPFWSTKVRIIGTMIWLAFILLDASHIMMTMKSDERESKIESLAERNAAWIMVLVMCLGIVYQGITSAIYQKSMMDWFLVGALWAGILVKSFSNLYLSKRPL